MDGLGENFPELVEEGLAKGPKREAVDRLGGDLLNFGVDENVCDEISGDEVNSDVVGLEPNKDEAPNVDEAPNDDEAPNVDDDARGEVEVIFDVAAERRP